MKCDNCQFTLLDTPIDLEEALACLFKRFRLNYWNSFLENVRMSKLLFRLSTTANTIWLISARRNVFMFKTEIISLQA